MKLVIKKIYQTKDETLVRVLIEKLDHLGNLIISGYASMKTKDINLDNPVLAIDEEVEDFLFIKVYKTLKVKQFHFEIYNINDYIESLKLKKKIRQHNKNISIITNNPLSKN